MSILTEGEMIWVSKEAHAFIVSRKKVEEEPIHRVIDRLLEIKKVVNP